MNCLDSKIPPKYLTFLHDNSPGRHVNATSHKSLEILPADFSDVMWKPTISRVTLNKADHCFRVFSDSNAFLKFSRETNHDIARLSNTTVE